MALKQSGSNPSSGPGNGFARLDSAPRADVMQRHRLRFARILHLRSVCVRLRRDRRHRRTGPNNTWPMA